MGDAALHLDLFEQPDQRQVFSILLEDRFTAGAPPGPPRLPEGNVMVRSSWHLVNAPRIGAQVTLTKTDLIRFL
jgi:hypothetical protein